MEQHCDKHNQFKPCQQCAKADVWEGEALVFKRDAEREIDQLRHELEEAKGEVSRLSYLMKSDVDAYNELEAEYDILKGRIEWFQETFEVDIYNRSALVERLKKEAVLASLFMDGQKDQIDQLRQSLDAVIELQLLNKQGKPRRVKEGWGWA
jgi:predicted RNase H-like nuclease (RuvC/YqgF family)